jgi:hypothetical protein
VHCTACSTHREGWFAVENGCSEGSRLMVLRVEAISVYPFTGFAVSDGDCALAGSCNDVV